MRARLPGWVAAAAAVIAYFAILLPYGATPLISHPDERHYAYAGIRMVETGDWLVPHTPDEEIRLKKPILPYWFAAAGFDLLGVGVPGFRLFWILAACATLGLTYAFARMLGAGESASLLALLLTAANPLFLRAGVQAIPDMPLTLFMLMASLGFCRILMSTDRPPRHAAWLGWIGIALAILTKGILPLVFAIFVIVFTAVFARARLKPLLAPLPVLVAAALVVSWFLYAVRNHPEEFAKQFFSDQVTGKVSFDPFRVLRQLPGYLATGIVSFFGLPLVLAVAWWRSSSRPAISSWPFVFKLLLAWTLAVPVMFSFGPFVAGRYLLPVLPIMAVLTVIGFTALARGPGILGRAAVWILVPVALIEIVLLVFGSAIELQLAPLWESAIFVGIAAALAAWIFSAVRNPARAPFALPWSFILTLALIFVPIARLVMPSIAEPVAARLDAAPASPLPLVSIHQDAEMYLRLLTGRAAPFRSLDSNDLRDACVVVTDRTDVAESLKRRGLAVETIRGGYDPELDGLFEAVVGWRLTQARRENADTVYFANCKS